jgi:GntR family transcriptional repressor for pyruvate dehydrogenase complex
MSERSERKADLSAVLRISRADAVRQQLEAAISSGQFRPGERLPSERELVELFGVSRLSVREGIRSLIGMGLVEARQGRGYFVVGTIGERYRNAFAEWLTIHSGELIVMYEVRGALLALAGRYALRRGDPQAITQIVDVHRDFIEAVRRNADAQEIADLDVRFHRAMTEASGSALLADLLQELYDRLEEPRDAVMALPGHRERSAHEHEAIVTALQSGDPEAVTRAVDEHIASVCRRISTHRSASDRA